MYLLHTYNEVENWLRYCNIFMGSMYYEPLVVMILTKGSPSGAWAVIEGLFSPQGAAIAQLWLAKYNSITMAPDEASDS